MSKVTTQSKLNQEGFELFAFHKKLDMKDPVLHHISCKQKLYDTNQGVFTIYTYTVNLPKTKNTFEDTVYASNPHLLEVLPRACSIVVHEGTIICVLEGPTKFSGRTEIDEDPEDEQTEDMKAPTIYNHGQIVKWAKDHHLEIVETEKANGKFAICKFFTYRGQMFIFCGSKNNHIITTLETIDKDITTDKNEIIVSILVDIRANYDKLLSLFHLFEQGYSLVGELCDGQHFTPGDNTISWFGLFQNGNPLNDTDCFPILQKAGLKTVSYAVVFTPANDIAELDNVFLDSRCKSSEGSVLRCRNIHTGMVVLVKTKAIRYIVMRFLRQILLRGYKEVMRIIERFVDAQGYHGLSTESAIRITRQLLAFSMWMMCKQYPVSVLGHQPVSSVRGMLPNGFNRYWQEFLSENVDNEDIVVKPDDFGEFNKERYVASISLYENRNRSKPAIVVFIQGLQGSGKSTMTDAIIKSMGINCKRIEQDEYYGDTLACQGALYHMISNLNGPDVIIVSRCNMNPKQYSRYLEICHQLPTVVLFFSPATVDPLYVMVSLAGIMKRSNVGDTLMVGRNEFPIQEVVAFVLANYDSYQPKSSVNLYTTFASDPELLAISTDLLKDRKLDDIIQFVKDNCERLMSIRFPVDHVYEPIINAIDKLRQNNYQYIDIALPEKPIFIGAAVDDNNMKLQSIVDSYVQDGVKYLHHMTQHFCEKGKPMSEPILVNLIKPGQKVVRKIDALVIRKADNACAFRIVSEPGDIKGNLHITARVPAGLKPMVSNSFVALTDDTVTIVPMDISIELTGFWHC